MAGRIRGKLAAALLLLLSGCRCGDQTEQQALREKVKAQEQKIAEQEREMASLRRRLANGTTKVPAAPQRPASPASEAEEAPVETSWRLALGEVSHRGRSLRARFTVTNLAAKRRSGRLCVRLLDEAGSQIDHVFSSERSIAAGAAEAVELDAPLSEKQWGEVARMEAYMAPLGCADDPPAHPLTFDKRGRSIPPSDR